MNGRAMDGEGGRGRNALAGWTEGLVLPRLLRRPARMLARLEWRPPRHAGLKGAAALFLAAGITGVIMGNHLGPLATAITARSGLGLEAVKITGQSETSELDVLEQLQVDPDTSLVTFDVAAARQRVEALPWVGEASIRKLYPNTLEVSITERKPFAIWQRGALRSLIDADGTVIADVGDSRYAGRYGGLPTVVGPGAARRAGEIVGMIDALPTLKPRVRAAVLVSERRWNLLLEHGISILLPETGAEAALREIVAIDGDSALLSRDIAAVDLRLPDRLVVRLTEDALAKRLVMLKERARAARRMGTDT